MRLAAFIASSVCGILVLGPGSGLLAQSGTGGSPRSGWYLGGGIGSNWASEMDQEGWNRETTCYPTETCFDANPVPEISGIPLALRYRRGRGSRVRDLGRLHFRSCTPGAIARAAEEQP